MTRAVEDFRLVAACIANDAGAGSPDGLGERLERASDRWPELLALAHRFYIAPELHHALARKGLLESVPAEPRELLAMTHALNVERNAAIRAQCAELLEALDARGVRPVMLKGGAWLFETPAAERGRRMMRDLDLLVPKQGFPAALDTLVELGYAELVDWPQWATYQYAPMGRPGDPASVELHHDVGEQRGLLPAADAAANAARVPAGDCPVLALSPTHSALHNIFNSEIQDRHHEVGIASLRQLHDLRLIVERHGAAIDWDWIATRMDANGYAPAFDCYVYLLNTLLGVAPPRSPRDPARCRRHYWRCLAQISWRPLMVASVIWATLTHPLQRLRLDYIAGGGESPAPPGGRGPRRIWNLLGRYRLGVFDKLAETYRKYDQEW